MTFAALGPLWVALAALATALAVVGVYLLRPTPRRQQVSNVDFWRRAAERSRPRLLFSRRIPLLALLVTLAAALIMVTLLGDPRFGEGSAGTTVIVLDADRSMSARDRDGATRLEDAIALARELTSRDTLTGRVAIVRAGVRNTVLVPLTPRPADVDRALRGFASDDAVADLDTAVGLAQRIVRRSGAQGRVVLLSDRRPSFDRLPPPPPGAPQVTVLWTAVGSQGETLAIRSLGARRDPDALGEYAVRCEVRAFTQHPATARLVIRDRSVVISDEPVELMPNGAVVRTAQGFSSGQAEISARLEHITVLGGADDLASDDVAFATVEPLVPTRVLLVTPGNRFLEQVLLANPAVALERIAPDALAARRAARGGLGAYDVVILDRVAPAPALDHPGQILFAPPAGSAVASTDALREPRVTAYASEHRVMSGVRFDQVHVHASRALAAESDDRVIVRSGRAALAIARERRGARLVAFGFDTEATDLVQRVAFPLMMHNALAWLDRREGAYQSWQRTGEPIRGASAESTVLLPSGEGRATLSGALYDTGRAGIYHAGTHAVAVSDVEDAQALVAPPSGSAAAGRAHGPPPLAAILLAALLAIVTVEWWLTQRGRLP